MSKADAPAEPVAWLFSTQKRPRLWVVMTADERDRYIESFNSGYREQNETPPELTVTALYAYAA
jgi:hypothetical protein